MELKYWNSNSIGFENLEIVERGKDKIIYN